MNKSGRRDLVANQTLSQLANSDCTNLAFKRLSLELACVEIDPVNHGEHGTKELQARLKCQILS